MAPAGTFPQLRPALQDAGPCSQPDLEPPRHCALAPSTAGCGAQAHAPPPLPAPRVPARAPARVPSTVLKFVPFTFIILLFVLHLTLWLDVVAGRRDTCACRLHTGPKDPRGRPWAPLLRVRTETRGLPCCPRLCRWCSRRGASAKAEHGVAVRPALPLLGMRRCVPTNPARQRSSRPGGGTAQTSVSGRAGG